MKLSFMRTVLAIVLALVILRVTARAQTKEENATANFERFLDNHPNVAADFARNPALANDSQYIAKHPAFSAFLESHPIVREQLHESPGTFASENGHYKWMRPEPATSSVWTDKQGYLMQHQDVAHDVEANPALLDDQKYVAAHPGLQEYMDHHPDLREQLRLHPAGFLGRSRGKGYGG